MININFNNIKFVTSSYDGQINFARLKEVLFVGRSNVGKSSLINALCNHKRMAYVSSTPGHTRLLNYYLIDNQFYLVDSPGYGYARRKNNEILSYGKMMENYLKNPYLALVVFLFDSRRILNEDDTMLLNYFDELKINYLLVLTKADKLNQSLKAKAVNYLKNNYLSKDILFVSSLNKTGIDILKEKISNFLAQ